MAKKKSRTSRRQRHNSNNNSDTVELADNLTSMSLENSQRNIVSRSPRVSVQQEPENYTLYNFLNNPGKDTVMLLDDYDIEILHVVAEQVDKDVVQDITIEFGNGDEVVINSKLSKQILNYVNGFRAKCNFGKCSVFETRNIRKPYSIDTFFSMEECNKKCDTNLVVLPSNIVDMIMVQYLDDIILDDDDLHLAKSKVPITEVQYDLVSKITVDVSYLHLNFDFFTNFVNLVHLDFIGIFNQSINAPLFLPKLTQLEFGDFFNQKIDNLDLPSLQLLRFGEDFNQSIDVVNNFRELRILKFGEKFNEPVQLNLPELIYIKFGRRFNRPIILDLPKLTHLKFGDFFDQPIERENFIVPKISELQFGDSFRWSIDDLDLLSLTALFIGENFDIPLNNVELPNLKYLVLGNRLLYDEIREYNRILDYNPTFVKLKELSLI